MRLNLHADAPYFWQVASLFHDRVTDTHGYLSFTVLTSYIVMSCVHLHMCLLGQKAQINASPDVETNNRRGKS